MVAEGAIATAGLSSVKLAVLSEPLLPEPLRSVTGLSFVFATRIVAVAKSDFAPPMPFWPLSLTVSFSSTELAGVSVSSL